MWSVYNSDGDLIAYWRDDVLESALIAARLVGGYEIRSSNMIRFFNHSDWEVGHAIFRKLTANSPGDTGGV